MMENDAKAVFKKCGTCSRTFAHLLNREFWYPNECEEKALNLLAGGIMNQGFQCGMLWGSALAIGAESYRRSRNLEDATVQTVAATRQVMDSFIQETGTINCKEIIGIDLSTKIGMAKFMLKITAQGMENSHCFNLAERWAPEAIHTARKALAATSRKTTEGGIKRQTASTTPAYKPMSCASEVIRRMQGSEEEMAMVAGFAGGLGLHGGACGALSAAIWKKLLDWSNENPEEDPPYFNNKEAKTILKAFKAQTNGSMRCSEICGRTFASLEDHSDYLVQGGCEALITTLAESAHAQTHDL